jgi:nitrous oxide reductase accessory protein NosL
LLASGCGSDDNLQSSAPTEPTPLADQEGAVCGMLVRNQSAPRGQVVHRDGTTLFLCSIGDLLVHLSAPSPHGRAVEVFVEVMEPFEEPGAEPHPWLPASEVVFVIGIERSNIMGESVLVYRSRDVAAEVIEQNPGAVALDFDALQLWWEGLSGDAS